MGNTAGIEAAEDDITPSPTPEDRVGPPISWGSGLLSPPVTPFIEGAESGTGEGAVNKGKLIPKLPDNDKVFKYDKTVSLMTESSLTGGSLIWETEEGLDATAGEVVTGVEVLRLLRLPAKETLCLRYADILSRDQVLHSGQRFSREQTIPRHDSHMVCKSNCKPLILRRHFGQEQRAAASTAAVAEVVENVVESMFQVIAKSR